MKKMKHLKTLLAALMTGMLVLSCNGLENEIQVPEENNNAKGPVNMAFTASVAAKGAGTKAVNESGVTTWVENEKIAVYYETSTGHATAIANVDAVNEGKATISATLKDAKDNSEVKFVYPASLVNETGDIDATKLQNDQHGTIANISANFDAATATATLRTSGTTCSTTTTVSFTNRVLIGKFTPTYGGSAIVGITTLTVTDGTYTYTVTPESGTFGTEGIYVAMLPVDNKTVSLEAATASQGYAFAGKTVTLNAGTLYTNFSIPMGLALKVVDDLGDEVPKNVSGEFELPDVGHYTVSGIGSGDIVGAGFTLTIEAGTILRGQIHYYSEETSIILNGDATVTKLASDSFSGYFVISGSGTLMATDGFSCTQIWLAEGVTIKCPENAPVDPVIKNASGTDEITPTIEGGYNVYVGSGTLSGGGGNGGGTTIKFCITDAARIEHPAPYTIQFYGEDVDTTPVTLTDTNTTEVKGEVTYNIYTVTVDIPDGATSFGIFSNGYYQLGWNGDITKLNCYCQGAYNITYE